MSGMPLKSMVLFISCPIERKNKQPAEQDQRKGERERKKKIPQGTRIKKRVKVIKGIRK